MTLPHPHPRIRDINRPATRSIQHTKHSFLHVVIEVFFAGLPLLILGAYWPEEAKHPKLFSQGPEWSMTACILYGLALARFLLGIRGMARPQSAGSTIAAISIIPLFGVIVSVILISKASLADPGRLVMYGQYLNIAFAILTFVLLGGYGLSRAEKPAPEST